MLRKPNLGVFQIFLMTFKLITQPGKGFRSLGQRSLCVVHILGRDLFHCFSFDDPVEYMGAHIQGVGQA